MEERHRWSFGLVVAGLALMLVALIDPLEGFGLLLAGGALCVIAARLAQSRWTVTLTWALALAALGCAAMLALSAFGGIGGTTGLPPVWGLVLLPYPVGGVLLIAIGIRLLVQVHRDGKTHGAPPSVHARH